MAARSSARTGRLAPTDSVLAHAWDSALRLAWDGLLAQTTPVGAVVVDSDGSVIAAGRGRRYEPTGPPGQLAGTHIAHAEVNALAQLPASRDWERAYLLTTLEPCGMCHGAAIQSTVGAIFFAGRDPYGGTAHARFSNPQAKRRDLLVEGPLTGVRGTLAEMLHIAFLLGRASAAHVVGAHMIAMPRLTAFTREVYGDICDAVRHCDYWRAAEIAGAAPRDP
jgi:tRNA(adenine34) deaminase